jgi:hypothetical protein
VNEVSPKDQVYYAAVEALEAGEDPYELMAAVREAIEHYRAALTSESPSKDGAQ